MVHGCTCQGVAVLGFPWRPPGASLSFPKCPQTVASAQRTQASDKELDTLCVHLSFSCINASLAAGIQQFVSKTLIKQ